MVNTYDNFAKTGKLPGKVALFLDQLMNLIKFYYYKAIGCEIRGLIWRK